MKRKKIFFRPMNKIVQEVTDPPATASSVIPQWYKNLPKYFGSNALFVENGLTNQTVKTCAPFLDSISSGYIIKLSIDLFCEKDENNMHIIKWQNGAISAIGSHIIEQLGEYPIPIGYSNQIFKFNGTWGIETPKGYSLLFMHPLGRFDLPFYTMHGIVDSDKHFIPMNLPFILKNDFQGVIKRGTPIAQVIPIKRDKWLSSIKDSEKFDPSMITNDITFSLEKWYKNKIWETKDYK